MKRTTEFEEDSLKKQKSEVDDDEKKQTIEEQFRIESSLERELEELLEKFDCLGIISFLEKQDLNVQAKLLNRISDNSPYCSIHEIAVRSDNISLLEWINKNHPKYITTKTFKDALEYRSFEIYIWLKTNKSDLYTNLSLKEKYRGEVKIERYLEYMKERESKTLMDGFSDAPIDKISSNMEESKAEFYFKTNGIKYFAEISWYDWSSAYVEIFDEYGIIVSCGEVIFKERIAERILYLSGVFPSLAEIAIDRLEDLDYDVWERCTYNTSEYSGDDE